MKHTERAWGMRDQVNWGWETGRLETAGKAEAVVMEALVTVLQPVFWVQEALGQGRE